jgi:hypothetical protein
MATYYIVHRDYVGLAPKREPHRVCATWVADGPADLPTAESLLAWCRDYGATFPADVVDEQGKLFLRDSRFP